MSEAIVILSGGLDSTVSAILAQKEVPLKLAITFDYGQRATLKEQQSALRIAKDLGIEHKIISLPWLKELTPTALVRGGQALPLLNISELDDREKTNLSARAVWVPNRNGLFLNVAAVFAESLDCALIVTGFNKEEAVTFSDNSASFVESANHFFSFSTLSNVMVKSYTQEMTKVEIVQKGIALGVDFSNLWSCYEGGPKMCGVCESCLRSLRAYQQAGVLEKVKAIYEN
ncbi:MAG: 7-cyano-7-deazaguanine synthase QueC [Deltaproteobacteria bacterium]|nr:7-cyano-7-deazaguanine synthase QueC [Deltaproteobacteria bacterium]